MEALFMAFNSPLGAAKAALLIDQLRISAGDRVLDAGCGNGEFLVQLASPDDPAALEALGRSRGWRDGYLRWGRATMGFGFYVFMKPPAHR